MAHHSQTADAASGVASEIEDEARAPELRDPSTDVARDVHSQNARKHADSDQASVLGHFRYGDDLVRNDNRTLLLSRTRNVQSRSDGRSIGSSNVQRVRMAQHEGGGLWRQEFLVFDGEQHVSRSNSRPGRDSARMHV